MILILLFVAAALALAVDGYQTLQIALHPEKWREVGWAHWLIGENPTPTGAVMYFALCIFLCAFAYYLPVSSEPKIGVYVAVIAVELVTVFKNYRLGIR